MVSYIYSYIYNVIVIVSQQNLQPILNQLYVDFFFFTFLCTLFFLLVLDIFSFEKTQILIVGIKRGDKI
jgi:hypothetical protein